MTKVDIIVPCYNESGNIKNLISALNIVDNCGLSVRYILVDNGSKDSTGMEIKAFKTDNMVLVTVPENKGYGYGLQQGMKACDADYIGWIHADLQCHPKELEQFFKTIASTTPRNYFLKGHRKNRSLLDRFFTWGQGVVNSHMFKKHMRDVASIPAIYPSNILMQYVDDMPNDFSIEIYTYLTALNKHLREIRYDVFLFEREKGQSSWNHGLKSKIKQAKRIYNDSKLIKKGQKVL